MPAEITREPYEYSLSSFICKQVLLPIPSLGGGVMNDTTDPVNLAPDPTLPQREALEYARLDEIAHLAALCGSYWRSVELAADRGKTFTVAIHFKQIIRVTREAAAVLATLKVES
jgi:hypothetical protein